MAAGTDAGGPASRKALWTGRILSGLAVLFRYGCAVLFDAAPLEADEFLRQIAPRIRQPYPEAERETEERDVVEIPGVPTFDEGGDEPQSRNTPRLPESLHRYLPFVTVRTAAHFRTRSRDDAGRARIGSLFRKRRRSSARAWALT